MFSGLYLLNRACYHMNVQIMSRYDFVGTMEVILSLTQFITSGQLSHELAQLMTTYDFLSAKQVILRNVGTDFNLTQLIFWSTLDRISTYNDHI